MSFKIGTNQQSLKAQNYLGKSTRAVHKASRQLSSGDRIETAANDPSGLAISEKLKAGIKSFGQAKRNINDGISLLQIVESDLASITNMVVRMKELSVAASSDTLDDGARLAIDQEFSALKREIDRTAQSSNFNGKKLLNGSNNSYELQVGIHGNKSTNTLAYNTKALAASTRNLGLSNTSISSKALAQTALTDISDVIVRLNKKRSDAGSLQSRLLTAVSGNDIQKENFSAGNSRIRDTDIAKAVSQRASQKLIQTTTTAILDSTNRDSEKVLRLLS